MTATYESPGLTADWINGWLAAVGTTVLIPGLRLAWRDTPVPYAVFQSDDPVDLPALLAQALPTPESLAASTIAARLPGSTTEFRRNVDLTTYQERAAVERAAGTAEVAACVSDLRADADPANLDHGAFDPPAPKGTTLWSRAQACAEAVQTTADTTTWVRDTLAGVGKRQQLNGLGFDPRRLPAGLHASGPISKVHADPVIELLCYAGLIPFPTRGDGRTIRQRGWTDRATRPGAFQWSAWRPPLDRWGIDALLDMASHPRDAIIARYRVIPYRPAGSSDTTRAYFAERVASW